jgi:hypothetical protein
MAKKFDAFISDLDQLCKNYDFTITSSLYDLVAVYNVYDPDELAMILDKTIDEVGESQKDLDDQNKRGG